VRSKWTPPALLNGNEKDWELPRLCAFVYIIGVLLKGDGSVFGTRTRRTLASGEIVTYHGHSIQLQVSPLEFATHFNLKCSLALGHPTVSIRGPDQKGMFFVTYREKDFGGWWIAQSLQSLGRFIRAFPREYLRGRFDSEANVNGYAVTLFGAEDHRDVMQHDRDLCAELGIRTGPLRVYCKKGARSYIEGRLVVTTIDKLRFGVNAKDFLRVIGGLAVKERDARLKSGIKGRAWTPWSSEVRARSIVLFRNGLNPKQISAKLKVDLGLDVPASTIYFWVRRGTKSWSDFDRA
jgi:hypothetical protein